MAVSEGVGVSVGVGVNVAVAVAVAVAVGVRVDVDVEVEVAVDVLVDVEVIVGVDDGVTVKVGVVVRVIDGVIDGVGVLVGTLAMANMPLLAPQVARTATAIMRMEIIIQLNGTPLLRLDDLAEGGEIEPAGEGAGFPSGVAFSTARLDDFTRAVEPSCLAKGAPGAACTIDNSSTMSSAES